VGTVQLDHSRFSKYKFPSGRVHYFIPRPKCDLCCEPLPIGCMTSRCSRCGPLQKIDGSTIERVIASTLYITGDKPPDYPANHEILQLKDYGANAGDFAVALSFLTKKQLSSIPPNSMVCPIPLRDGIEPGHYKTARILAELFEVPYLDALAFREPTATQKSVQYHERLTNLNGKMESIINVDGKTVFVVDDVMTTGSTLHEGARAMKEKGAARVIGLVAARATSSKYLSVAGVLKYV
jgi:predicted amidophosphoribosyltransferase